MSATAIHNTNTNTDSGFPPEPSEAHQRAITPPNSDKALYDGVEVHGLRYAVSAMYPDHLEPCDEDDPAIVGWSTYLHLRTGGIESIQDFKTMKEATVYGHDLITWLQSK